MLEFDGCMLFALGSHGNHFLPGPSSAPAAALRICSNIYRQFDRAHFAQFDDRVFEDSRRICSPVCIDRLMKSKQFSYYAFISILCTYELDGISKLDLGGFGTMLSPSLFVVGFYLGV